jgi:hypothetical protein
MTEFVITTATNDAAAACSTEPPSRRFNLRFPSTGP